MIAARALGPEGKGIATAALTWSLMIGWAGSMGLDRAMSVRIASARSSVGAALGNSVVYGVVAGGVLAGMAIAAIPPRLAHLGPDAQSIATWAMVGIPIAIIAQALMAIHLGLHNNSAFNRAQISGPMVTIVATVGLWLGGLLTPGGVVLSVLAGGVSSFLIAALGHPWREFSFQSGLLKTDLKFGARLHLAGFLSLATFRLDLLVMSLVLSANEVGQYSLASNAMVPVSSLATAAYLLLGPRIARIASQTEGDSDARSQQLAVISQQARTYTIVGACCGLTLAAVAPFVVPWLFGNTYQAAVSLIWILVPGYVLRIYAAIVSAGVSGMRRSWVGNSSELVAFIVTVALLPFLLPGYGTVGAALTTSLAYSASGLTAFVSFRYLRALQREGRRGEL